LSVVATQSVHALLRDLVANSPRRDFLHDTEGIELSNQAALVREVVVTVQACLEPDLRALRETDAPHPGERVVASIAQYDEILRTLLDAAPLIETGRMSTAWTLLGSATDRLRVLTALEAPAGDDAARRLADASARARAQLIDAMIDAMVDDVDVHYPSVIVATAVATRPVPTLPAPTPAIASLVELVDLGAATVGDGGAEHALPGSSPGTDYDHLAMVGGHQLHLVLEIIRAATDSMCAVAAQSTDADAWAERADDVRAAVEFAWDCV